MVIRLQEDCEGVDWERVAEVLLAAGLGTGGAEVRQKAFENSDTVVFVHVDELLVGVGRALSDGVLQAAIYDVAVHPDHQGNGLGRLIVENLAGRLPECNLILFASVGKEGFYRKLGFRRLLTGMGLFRKAEAMRERGFTD